MFSGRVLFDLVLLNLAAIGAFQASGMSGFGQIGPGGFPMAIMGIGVVVMLAILVSDLRHALRRTPDAVDSISAVQAIGLGAFVVLLALYLLALEPFGFVPATVGFLFIATLVSTWLLDPQAIAAGWARIAGGAALFAAIATLASYYTFTAGFGLVFP